ncbi:MAG: hypothetical protein JRI95_14160 [Deltaproteobacteria bacterium]|nr:hypothetical protein [Deltaproteobacteria bacterium]MBW2087051.1 hypothetical protein [Deltaproteobacteria bacterium]
MKADIRIENFLGKRTLILGEVNTGKTRLCKGILDEFCVHLLGRSIIVLDLAPEIPKEATQGKGLEGIGGRLLPDEEQGVLYLKADIRPPRLSSGSEQEAMLIASQNVPIIDDLFQVFIQSPRDILFINDLSLYLQAGSADRVAKHLDQAQTVVANGYYGQRLGSGQLSKREAKEMEVMIEFFDSIIRL